MLYEDSKAIHKSRRPLRWFANWAGNLASRGILDISYMEENAYTGWKYKVNLFLWNTFFPIYDRWGTVYIWDMDTDEYWDSLEFEEDHWDYIDEDTGDAFKVINYGQ